MYCRVDATVPILRIWRDEGAEVWQDFRLSRRAMNSLQKLLDRGQDHGWGNDLEVLIYTYWLAHGLSYRVVSSVFSVPKATVHSHTPGGTEHMEQFEQGDLLPTGRGAASSRSRVCRSLRDPCICKCRRGDRRQPYSYQATTTTSPGLFKL